MLEVPCQRKPNPCTLTRKSTGPLECPTVSPAGALPWLPWAHQTPLVPPCLLQASQLNVKPPTPCCAPCSCNETLHVGQVTAWQPEQVRQWDGGGCIARCEACHDRSKSTAQNGRHATGSPSNMGPRRRAHMEFWTCWADGTPYHWGDDLKGWPWTGWVFMSWATLLLPEN